MVRLSEVTALHEVRQITHCRHEAIRERCHVAHARFVRRLGHLFRFGIIHCQRFFTEDVFARCDGGQPDGPVQEVGRGDDDRLHVVALHHLFVFRRGDFDASLLTRALQCGRISIAERDDFRFGTQRKARKMILQRDAAAADDGDADLLHEREGRVWRSTGQRQALSVRCTRKRAHSTKSFVDVLHLIQQSRSLHRFASSVIAFSNSSLS